MQTGCFRIAEVNKCYSPRTTCLPKHLTHIKLQLLLHKSNFLPDWETIHQKRGPISTIFPPLGEKSNTSLLTDTLGIVVQLQWRDEMFIFSKKSYYNKCPQEEILVIFVVSHNQKMSRLMHERKATKPAVILCVCLFSLRHLQVTVMQTVWFSISFSTKWSLATSAWFLSTGTLMVGLDSDWKPMDVLTVSFCFSVLVSLHLQTLTESMTVD